ncbi:MAG: GTP 3',8-cyclase MoaA [Chloroflexota bacterium]
MRELSDPSRAPRRGAPNSAVKRAARPLPVVFDGRPGIVDTFGRALRDLRISVTDRCNFRCTYCMPREVFGTDYAFLPRSMVLSFEEIERLARIFVALGTRKLRVTGGEPLVRRDLPLLIALLAAIPTNDDEPLDITLTTNGSALRALAPALRDAGLGRVTVSLDSLDDAEFRAMNGIDFPVARVLDGIAAAREAGFDPIKVNMVVKRGANDGSIVPMARWARAEGHVLRFIEYMDVGTTNGWRLDEVVTADEIVAAIDAELPLDPVEPGYRGEVAGRYRYRDGSGEVGVIASVSKPFCGDCTRARLSAEGRLHTCLFGSEGVDLRGPLRDGATDDEVEAIVRRTWKARTDRYSEERSEETAGRRKVEMFAIGG